MVWALTVVVGKPKSLSSSVIFLVDGGAVDGDGDEGDVGACVLWMVKRRRLMSSRVAAGILSLLAEMNWMRASSRVSAGRCRW